MVARMCRDFSTCLAGPRMHADGVVKHALRSADTKYLTAEVMCSVVMFQYVYFLDNHLTIPTELSSPLECQAQPSVDVLLRLICKESGDMHAATPLKAGNPTHSRLH